MRKLDFASQLGEDARWPKLHPSERLVYMAMAQGASKENWFGSGVIWLSKATGMQATHVYRSLRILTREMYIEKDPANSGSFYLRGHTTNVTESDQTGQTKQARPNRSDQIRQTNQVTETDQFGHTEVTKLVTESDQIRQTKQATEIDQFGQHSPLGSGREVIESDAPRPPAQESFGNAPDSDEPNGVFSDDSMARTQARRHAREDSRDIWLESLLLEYAQSFLGRSNCVYWYRNFSDKLEVSEAEGLRAWKQLIRDGRLERVEYCEIHNGKRVCYRLPQQEIPPKPEYKSPSERFKPAAQFRAEENARREREEAKMQSPLILPSEDEVWMDALLDTLPDQPDDGEVTSG